MPAPLRGLGITFIITGLMGIGFLSFGGMLTGGDEESAKKDTTEQVQTIDKANKDKVAQTNQSIVNNTTVK